MNKRQKEILQAYLDSEKATLDRLTENYQDALDEINTRIAILLGRQDADLQHVVYQVEYQRALRTQIQSILEQLQAKEFETVSEYLTNSYQDGFIGTMYDLHGQGIPLILPIDQESVVAAIQHETKLSEKLYTRLGKDIKVLQKQIAGEISRGISTGQMFAEIARNLSNYANISKNKAMTITVTEGHRIQNKATFDAQHKAKAKGADVVKQWDAALDGRTRPSHRRVDGEIRELDEPFSNGLMYPGDPQGSAKEVIRCRCALLQRARWAVGEDFTKWTSEDGIVEINARDYQEFKDEYFRKLDELGESKRVRSNVQKMNDEDASDNLKKFLNNKKNDLMNKINEHEPVSFNDLQHPYKSELQSVVDSATGNVKKVTDKYLDSVYFVNEKRVGSAKTTKKGIHVNLADDAVDERGKWSATFHEMGHAIDRATGRISYKYPDFKNYLLDDFDGVVKSFQRQYNTSKNGAYAKISQYLHHPSCHSISDLIGGITDNKCMGKYGHHDEEYWKKPHRLEAEAFAHFYEATIRNDIEKLEAIKWIFPNAYVEFEKMLGEII